MKRKKIAPYIQPGLQIYKMKYKHKIEDKMFARATKQGYSQGHKIGYKHKTQSRRHNFCTHSPRFCMRPTTQLTTLAQGCKSPTPIGLIMDWFAKINYCFRIENALQIVWGVLRPEVTCELLPQQTFERKQTFETNFREN